MATLGEYAKEYEPKQMLNIADLEVVSVTSEIIEEDRKDNEGKPYHVKYILLNGKEYRVANTVLEQLKNLIADKPNLNTFKVKKTGEGFGTKYQVISLD